VKRSIGGEHGSLPTYARRLVGESMSTLHPPCRAEVAAFVSGAFRSAADVERYGSCHRIEHTRVRLRSNGCHVLRSRDSPALLPTRPEERRSEYP
jgi:hypothetical protein